MSVFYTGIGSRETPRHICIYMSKVAKILDKRGYILRSGGAQGADKAFQSSATNPIIYRGNSHIPQWAFNEAKKYLPTHANWSIWNDYTKKLVARNMMLVLGKDGKTPSDFVLCWSSDITRGGTGYGVRCAMEHDILVYNFYYEIDINDFNFTFDIK